jgi:hypothetical protein
MSMMVTETPASTAIMKTVTNVSVTPSFQDDVSTLDEDSIKVTSSSRYSFGSKRSVLTLTQKGPRVLIQVRFYEELPIEFVNSFMPILIPLASIVKKDDNGYYTYESKWMSTQVLPKVWDKVESVLLSHKASMTALPTLKATFEEGSLTSLKEAISKLLHFVDEEDEPMSMMDLQSMIEDFKNSRWNTISWRLYFTGNETLLHW